MMLCLNRKLGQGIQVNDDVTIEVIDIRQNSVRLGITYGEKSRVLRREVYLKVKEENTQSLLPPGEWTPKLPSKTLSSPTKACKKIS